MTSQLDRLQEPLQRVAKALGDATRSLCDFARAMIEFLAAALSSEDIRKVTEQHALNAAPPRIRYLATHGKKRTRKKNINRALREYRRRGKQ